MESDDNVISKVVVYGVHNYSQHRQLSFTDEVYRASCCWKRIVVCVAHVLILKIRLIITKHQRNSYKRRGAEVGYGTAQHR